MAPGQAHRQRGVSPKRFINSMQRAREFVKLASVAAAGIVAGLFVSSRRVAPRTYTEMPVAQSERDKIWSDTLAATRKQLDEARSRIAELTGTTYLHAACRREVENGSLVLPGASRDKLRGSVAPDQGRAPVAAMQDATGYRVLGRLDANELVDQFLGNLVAFAHPQEALLLADGTSMVGVLGQKVDLTSVESCTEFNVVFTGKGMCYAMVQIPERLGGSVPGLVIRHTYDAEAGKWRALAKAKIEGDRIPTTLQRSLHEKLVLQLLSRIEDVEAKLRPVLQKTARNSRVKVMVLNAGNLDLFLNLMCSVEQADLSGSFKDLIVFAADASVEETLKSLGVAVFRHEAFGDLPQQESHAYGDYAFLKMMWLKIVSAWSCNRLGYDVLYLDSDLIFFSDPDAVLNEYSSADLVMQDDGARSERFSPYFGNTGFFLMRSNDKTKHLMQMMLFSWELCLAWQSHQSVFTYLLQDHYIRHAIVVQTLPYDVAPTGKMFHHDKKGILEYVTGVRHACVFHMNWTLNKTEKLKYLRELGWWFVQDQCMADRLPEGMSSVGPCCGGREEIRVELGDGLPAHQVMEAEEERKGGVEVSKQDKGHD